MAQRSRCGSQRFFGEENVNTDGKIAINIPEVKGSRPSIDIVPSFDYVRYDDALQTPNLANKGSCVFPKGGGLKIVNWPEQQYDNGVLKNDLTTKRYKRFVRALKNAENVLVDAEVIEELPSYFMECLVYNADNSVFYQPGDDLQSAFKRVIIDISSKLENEDRVPMVEPNELKYLFRGESKWSVDKAKTLLNETWNFLGYDED